MSAVSRVIWVGSTPRYHIRVWAIAITASVTWQVSNFHFNTTPGVIQSFSAESINLTQGRPEDTITVSVSAPAIFPGSPVEIILTGPANSVPVFFHRPTVRAQFTSPPSRIQIDAHFSVMDLRA